MEIKNETGWADKTISQLNIPQNKLIVLIKRGKENIIPSGKTEIKQGDIVVTLDEKW